MPKKTAKKASRKAVTAPVRFNPTTTCKAVAQLYTPFRLGSSKTLMDFDVQAHEFQLTSRDLTMDLFAYRFHDGSLHVHEKFTGVRVPPLEYAKDTSLAKLMRLIQQLLDETPDTQMLRDQFTEFGKAGTRCECHETYGGAMKRIKQGIN